MQTPKIHSNCTLKFVFTLSIVFLFSILHVTMALANEDLAEGTKPANTEQSLTLGTQFFSDAEVSGGLYFFRRYRTLYRPETGRYESELNHGSLQATAEFSSGLIANAIGFDFGVLGSHDIINKGEVNHEFGFVPWNDPWHPDWSKKNTKDTASIYRAAIKAKAGPFWGRGGYYQPDGPGVLGVNWSFTPGTYRGFNVGANFEKLSVAFAWADQYKSPWYSNYFYLCKNDGVTRVPSLWSIGASYAFNPNFQLELAYGKSKGHLKNAHFKSLYTNDLAGGTLKLGFHLYAMDDSDDSGESPNDNFGGVASQYYLFSHFDYDYWTFKFHTTYTKSSMTNSYHRGFFPYRLADRSGSSRGAYSPWWESRGSWNAHNEKAFHLAIERKLDDIFAIKGFGTGVSATFGYDGKAYETAEHLKEWAFNAKFGYTCPEGLFKGSFVMLYFTEFRNSTNKPSYIVYKNAFQSERDFMLMCGVKF